MNLADRHLVFARSLFREANDAFFLFEPRTLAIVDLNPAARRMTGLEKDAARSLRLEDLFPAPAPGRWSGSSRPSTRPGSSIRRRGTSSGGPAGRTCR